MTHKLLIIGAQSAASSVDMQPVWTAEADVFTLQPTVSPLVTAARYGAAFSNDGIYYASCGGVQNGSTLAVYKRDGVTFSLLASVSAMSGVDKSLAWSASGTYLAVTGNSPYVNVLKRSGDNFVSVATVFNGQYVASCHWYGDEYLALGIGNQGLASGVRVWKRNADTDTFSELSVPPSQPQFVQVSSVHFSSDGAYLTAAFVTTNGIRVWKRNGDTFTLIGSLITGGEITYFEAPSTKCNYLLARSNTNIFVFKRAADVISLIGLLPTPLIGIDHIAFSGDDIHVAAVSYSNGSRIWRRDGDTFAVVGSAPGVGSFNPRTVAWWPNVERDTTYKAISGHVYDNNGSPISRKVRSHNRVTGNMIAETISDAITGEYSMDGYMGGENYVIVLDDVKNAMIYDHITPTA